MEALRRSVEAGFNSLNTRLDRVVPNELFQAYQQAVERQFADHERELAALKAEREADKKAREDEKKAGDNQRRLALTAIFTSVIAPLVILLFNLWLTSKGS